MAAALTVPERGAALCDAHGPKVERVPLYFRSQCRSLFAWLHRGAQTSDHGIVICPPLGHEQVHSQRSLRHLADALAAAEFPVLRFDYHGTGDSEGTDEDPESVAAWLSNIRDAHAWLRHELGCRRVTLIGVRLGATFATYTATETSVEGLVLWAPVVKGRAYVREMKVLSQTSALPRNDTPRGIEAGGLVLTDQMVSELSRLDLLQTRPECRRVLIVGRDDAPAESTLCEHFTALGIEAAQCVEPGYVDMMTEPHDTKVPGRAIARMVAWLRASQDTTAPEALRALSAKSITMFPYPDPEAFSFETPRALREKAVWINREPELFGILSEPASGAAPKAPFILMVNAGAAYRVGPNRLYVSLARQLAAHGFRSLRMDLSGLGDSVCSDPERENDPYPATAFRDIDLALRYLRDELGVERVVLMGLCSGAYAAFQSAAQLASPMVIESVLINPLTYFWAEGMTIENAPAQQLKSFQDTMSSIWQPRKWLKVLAGRSKLGMRGVLKLLRERWRLGKAKPKSGLLRREHAVPSHPAEEDLPGDLDRIVHRGRHLACFFARSDPGFGLLTLHARRKVNQLRRAGILDVYFLDDANHTFTNRAPRRALGQTITEHLRRRYTPR